MLIIEISIFPLFGVLTYFSIKSGLSIEIEKQNVPNFKFCISDTFSSVRMCKRYDFEDDKAS